jgi:hypothetical protein
MKQNLRAAPQRSLKAKMTLDNSKYDTYDGVM